MRLRAPGNRTSLLIYNENILLQNNHIFISINIGRRNSRILVLKRKFWDLIKDSETTTFGGVPYTYEMLKRLKFDQIHCKF